MSSWLNVKLIKCQVDEMSSWWNVKLMKHQVDEMSSWSNVISTICYFITLPFQQPAISSMCHFINLSFHQPAILSTCHIINLLFHQLVISSICIFDNLPYEKLAIWSAGPLLRKKPRWQILDESNNASKCKPLEQITKNVILAIQSFTLYKSFWPNLLCKIWLFPNLSKNITKNFKNSEESKYVSIFSQASLTVEFLAFTSIFIE